MNLITFDDVILDPKAYVKNIFEYGFQDIADGEKVFKNIQPRDTNDEFAKCMKYLFPAYRVDFNFVRQSPLNQLEPNFIHKDDMMGDLTALLYLNEEYTHGDGTTLYDKDNKEVCKMTAKFNRMIAFDASIAHSRNIFDNFGEGDSSRLIQVAFLKFCNGQ